ncbi:MAG: glycerophosphodiester phosphodiesterase family protein [Gammaproteobacteria bacterium]|nr:glycerophosphodiester phosphodiesterase family protein [Gammaproteobacteria bacterium]MDH5802672.1 glycerophosphodiester phosphodiesterase family protein [Gammaproteobacteria bacterium]
MKAYKPVLSLAATTTLIACSSVNNLSQDSDWWISRPKYLVSQMKPGELHNRMQNCGEQLEEVLKKTEFSISHRGAPMGIPEHTRESYLAATTMGAGIIECDVTFTRDKELVCRHSQCDLHTTTNILATPLAKKCRQEFTPAAFDASGKLLSPADAKCCTSELTLAEFKSLQGKMDHSNPQAKTVREYLKGDPQAPVQYTGTATLMSHRESIELFKSLDVKMIPELKHPEVDMPFDGFTKEAYAQKLVTEYKMAGVSPDRVYLQSFFSEDIQYWLKAEPDYAKQVVFLDGRFLQATFNSNDATTWKPRMVEIAASGVHIIAPPLWMLLTLDGNKQIVPSTYALEAKKAGLDIIPWVLERSGSLNHGGGWFYQSINDAISTDGDSLAVLDVLTKKVGIRGIFSDWPATVSYYANCTGLDRK